MNKLKQFIKAFSLKEIKNNHFKLYAVIFIFFFVSIVLITNVRKSPNERVLDYLKGHWKVSSLEDFVAGVHPTDIIFDYNSYIVQFSNDKLVKVRPKIKIFNITYTNRNKNEIWLVDIEPFIGGGVGSLFLVDKDKIRVEELKKGGIATNENDYNLYFLSYVGR